VCVCGSQLLYKSGVNSAGSRCDPMAGYLETFRSLNTRRINLQDGELSACNEFCSMQLVLSPGSTCVHCQSVRRASRLHLWLQLSETSSTDVSWLSPVLPDKRVECSLRYVRTTAPWSVCHSVLLAGGQAQPVTDRCEAHCVLWQSFLCSWMCFGVSLQLSAVTVCWSDLIIRPSRFKQ
jgi:hypothetical protein